MLIIPQTLWYAACFYNVDIPYIYPYTVICSGFDIFSQFQIIGVYVETVTHSTHRKFSFELCFSMLLC